MIRIARSDLRVHKVRAMRRGLRSYLARSWPLYLMFTPVLIYLAVFQYYPMYGLIIAFKDYKPALGFFSSPWAGIKHFERIFTNPSFLLILRNTVVISISKSVLGQLCAVILALMLYEVPSVIFRRVVQNIVYLPHFLSWVVLSGILLDLLSSAGLVNQALGRLGVQRPILFLGDNRFFVPTLVVSHLWQQVGWSTIIILAALMGIDPQLHEAAAIDGANRWQRMWNVTLPGISPTVILIACLSLGSILQAGFEQVLNLYNPVVYRTGDILDTYVYRQGIERAQYSLATAVGLFKSFMGFLFIVIAYRLADKYSGYRIF